MAALIGYSALIGVIAYLCGSIPTGYWLGKLLRGIDIRDHGSKSTGATNVLRTLGKLPALVVLLIDVLKGVAAVAFARWLYSQPALIVAAPASVDLGVWLPWIITVAALIAMLGHGRSIWIQFTGGKSAATGLGVLLAMSWQVGVGVAISFGIVLAVSRIVSLSSISAAVAAIVLMVIFHQPAAYLLMAIAGATYLILRHKANIQRLLSGKEPRLGQSQSRVKS
ncbi:glycerol-3-phosphate 1-O-acyltransferase PlsY [Burkholderia sp. AU38729]|uniref:glycerol-3-phosphate 1-O-acyltransferase PlsY n=1 Tax=Burkholderia sp. AU38729 TaxID=2879633 RepID=UPI001CF36939|nr:glycerol-3-phosphate 1-O-acyltransferase PlsY [Burkholderia sp. AU38729]MCA8065422.1 glycerol-3-phosphate 1-O-acyltransferase PlsY [Burkholderia sp. AU38729]